MAGYIVIVTDISERKRVERMKTEFISTISHELRTPLTSIAGSLGLVAAGVAGPLPERAQHMVAIAQKNSERLSTLINDLLDLEKLVDGGLPILAEPHDVMPIVEQAIRDNEGYATHLPDGTSCSARPLTVPRSWWTACGSSRCCRTCCPTPRSSRPRARTSGSTSRPRDETVRVSVSDSGPGIEHAFRARIFQKFSQADGSDARSRGGSGLGPGHLEGARRTHERDDRVRIRTRQRERLSRHAAPVRRICPSRGSRGRPWMNCERSCTSRTTRTSKRSSPWRSNSSAASR